MTDLQLVILYGLGGAAWLAFVALAPWKREEIRGYLSQINEAPDPIRTVTMAATAVIVTAYVIFWPAALLLGAVLSIRKILNDD